MKPVSIIFLIISAILIAVGLILCSVGMLQAKRQGIDLYDTTIVNGQSEATVSFATDEISKLQIEAGQCDVKVVFGAESDYAVIKNFSSAGYICEVENKALVIEDTVNIFNLMDIAQGNFRFKGFRYYLRDRQLSGAKKEVIVYLSDRLELKTIDISIDEGTVEFSGCDTNTDYFVKINKGTLVSSDIVTNTSFKAEIVNGDIDISNVTAKLFELKVTDGNIKAGISGQEITANAEKGNIEILSSDDLEQFNYSLKAPAGTVTLGDLVKKSNYIATDAMLTRFIHATSTSGSITVRQYVAPIQTDPSTETEPSGAETTVVEDTTAA